MMMRRQLDLAAHASIAPYGTMPPEKGAPVLLATQNPRE
jgi:hypothetical protein